MMKGYRPQVDWGGEGGSATIALGGRNVKVATAGWRRRCLFIFLFSLLIISVLNFILTLWILKKISFNAEGAGDLQVRSGGIKLDGNFFLNHKLSVEKILSQAGKDLDIKGFHNVSLLLLNEDGNMFSLDPVAVSSVAKAFKVYDDKGLLLFGVDNTGSEVGAKYFTVTGNQGAIIDGSLQTPRLLGNTNEFRIESKTRTIKGRAGSLLRVEARDGDVNVISMKDIKLHSNSGKIRFESPTVFFSKLASYGGKIASTAQTPESQIEAPNLKPAPTRPYANENGPANEDISVYQVCVCQSGRLFLSPADNSNCENDPKWEIDITNRYEPPANSSIILRISARPALNILENRAAKLKEYLKYGYFFKKYKSYLSQISRGLQPDRVEILADHLNVNQNFPAPLTNICHAISIRKLNMR